MAEFICRHHDNSHSHLCVSLPGPLLHHVLPLAVLQAIAGVQRQIDQLLLDVAPHARGVLLGVRSRRKYLEGLRENGESPQKNTAAEALLPHAISILLPRSIVCVLRRVLKARVSR